MANWIGVVTNVGNALFSQWLVGTKLNISSAAAGTGTVPPAALLAQTALVNQKQVASIVSYERMEKGIKLKVQITAPQTGYFLNQFGLWGTLDSGTPTMVAIFQNEDSIPIPNHADSPDFVYTFYGIIAMSNTGDFSVTVDASAVVSMSTMTAAISEAVATKQEAIKTVGVLKGQGNGSVSAALAGTDYVTPSNLNSAVETHSTNSAAHRDIRQAVETAQTAANDAKAVANGITLGSISGILPVSRGGTGKTSWVANRLAYPSGSTTMTQLLNPTTSGSFLRQNTSGAPFWTGPADVLGAIGAVPETRTINGKALTGNITLTAPEMGAPSLGNDGKISLEQMPNIPPAVTTSGSGSAYTATIDGITEISKGLLITIIPHTSSTSVSPTLNLNGMGAKTIKRRYSYTNDSMASGQTSSWLYSGRTQLLQYDGGYWIAIGANKPYGPDMYGTVGISNGGTGKTSWTSNRLVYASTSSTLTQLAPPTSGTGYLSQGVSGAPSWVFPANMEVGRADFSTESASATEAVHALDSDSVNGYTIVVSDSAPTDVVPGRITLVYE
ncbi:hypothetical protein [Anaeromassilibacillus senegalensis]|uniref:hypothetical protein n=1 Tax=Anaeromassilibacillus senegalensis TaxID=1673717 RepID=UPI000682F100|nr:hypothetical protein [Anaeromassilibacillus senegalensis]